MVELLLCYGCVMAVFRFCYGCGAVVVWLFCGCGCGCRRRVVCFWLSFCCACGFCCGYGCVVDVVLVFIVVSLNISDLSYLLSLMGALFTFNVARVQYLNLHPIAMILVA